jgi:PAS domain S-box-containing protein
MSFIRSRLSWGIENLNSFPTAILVVLIAVLSYLSLLLGSGMSIPPHNVSPLWPTNAVVLVVLLAVRRRLWPILITTAYAVIGVLHVLAAPIAVSLCLTLGNAVEVIVAAFGIRYFFKGVPRLNSTKSLSQYSLVAAVLAPIAGAFIGALAARPAIYYWLHWKMWFLSDGLALFTLPPAVWGLVHLVSGLGRKSHIYYLELITLTTVLILFGYATLVASGRSTPQALLYPLVPLLLWFAFRFGSGGTSISVLVVSVLSIWGAVHGRGPFTELGPIDSVLSLQLFLLFTAAPFMVLAVLVEERKHDEQALRESEERLRVGAEISRMYAWEWDPVTDSVLRTAESAHILGLAGANPQGSAKEYFTLVHPNDRAGLWGLVNALTPKDPVYRTQYRRFHPGGELLWLEESGCGTFDDRGKMVRLVGMTVDITGRKRAEEALSSVSRRLISSQEEERARIARDLHDDIGQRLALLNGHLHQLSQGSPDIPDAVRSRLGELNKQISEIATDIQTLSHQLHSSKLRVLGVAAAIRGFCRELSEQKKVKIEFSSHDVPASLPEELSLCLFRVTQEALHNAEKHSRVGHFEVQLWGTPGEIHLIVMDTGAGFDKDEAAKESRGLGLTSMQERLNLLNGMFSIESQPGRGTTVHASVPLISDGKPMRADG